MDYGGVRFPSRERPPIGLKCSVEGCESNTQVNLNLKFHPFPRKSYNFEVVNPVTMHKKIVWTYQVWKRALDINRVDSNTLVCSLHFRRSDYIDIDDESMCRLKPNAFPSCNMFLPAAKVWFTSKEEIPPSEESGGNGSESEEIPKTTSDDTNDESGSKSKIKRSSPLRSSRINLESEKLSKSDVDKISKEKKPIINIESPKTSDSTTSPDVSTSSKTVTPNYRAILEPEANLQETRKELKFSISSASPKTSDSSTPSTPNDPRSSDKRNVTRSGEKRPLKMTPDPNDAKRIQKRKLTKTFNSPKNLHVKPQTSEISNISLESSTEYGKALSVRKSPILKSPKKMSVETQTNITINPRTFKISKSSQTKHKYFSDTNSVMTQTSQRGIQINSQNKDRSETNDCDNPELVIDVNKITESEQEFQVVNTISDSNSQRIKIHSKIKLPLGESAPINVTCDGVVDVNSVNVKIVKNDADEEAFEEVFMEIDITGKDIKNVQIEIGTRTWRRYLGC